VGNGEAARRGDLAGREIRALRDRQRELAQRPAHLRLLALHLIEAIDRLHRDHHGVLDAPCDLAPLDLLLRDIDHRFVRSGFVEELDDGLDGRAELLVAKVPFLAQAEEEDAIGERAADIVQKQRCAEFALHVAAADDFAHISIRRAVDQLGRQGQLPVVEDADDDAGAPLFFRTTAFYGKFHCRPEPPTVGFLCRNAK
jgi:hypothetical protein